MELRTIWPPSAGSRRTGRRHGRRSAGVSTTILPRRQSPSPARRGPPRQPATVRWPRSRGPGPAPARSSAGGCRRAKKPSPRQTSPTRSPVLVSSFTCNGHRDAPCQGSVGQARLCLVVSVCPLRSHFPGSGIPVPNKRPAADPCWANATMPRSHRAPGSFTIAIVTIIYDFVVAAKKCDFASHQHHNQVFRRAIVEACGQPGALAAKDLPP